MGLCVVCGCGHGCAEGVCAARWWMAPAAQVSLHRSGTTVRRQCPEPQQCNSLGARRAATDMRLVAKARGVLLSERRWPLDLINCLYVPSRVFPKHAAANYVRVRCTAVRHTPARCPPPTHTPCTRAVAARGQLQACRVAATRKEHTTASNALPGGSLTLVSGSGSWVNSGLTRSPRWGALQGEAPQNAC